MNSIIFLLLCCCLFVVSLSQSLDKRNGLTARNWRRKSSGSTWEKKREYYRKKYKNKMMSFTKATWKTIISDLQVSESARYRDGLDVVFMRSSDNILEDQSLLYEKSFFIYDVDAALGAIGIGYGQHCFITDMDNTKTMDIVKSDLRSINNTEAVSPKPLSELYVSKTDSITTENLLSKSYMISAICSRAANCDQAYITTLTKPEGDTVQTWKTSGLYKRYMINFTFNPEEETTQCRPWQNYWRKLKNRKV